MAKRTVQYDDAEWQVAPKNPVPAMIESGANEVIERHHGIGNGESNEG